MGRGVRSAAPSPASGRPDAGQQGFAATSGAAAWQPNFVIGIDDWAWRRNQRYGTLICDLERRRTIALLPDRDPATAEAWLSEQQQIALIARDRGGG